MNRKIKQKDILNHNSINTANIYKKYQIQKNIINIRKTTQTMIFKITMVKNLEV